MAAASTEKGRLVRARIIEATARQILAAGIGGTTLDSVRAATLTSKSQLFHYFPGGKAELVREVALWEAEQLAEAQQPHLQDLGTWDSWRAWRDALQRYYFGIGRWACPIGTLAQEAAGGDPALAREVAHVLEEWQRALALGIRRMQRSGAMRDDADAERLASAVVAAIQGGLLLAQLQRSPDPLRAAIDLAFAGLAASRSLPVPTG